MGVGMGTGGDGGGASGREDYKARYRRIFSHANPQLNTQSGLVFIWAAARLGYRIGIALYGDVTWHRTSSSIF
jgi:hypothetical protein